MHSAPHNHNGGDQAHPRQPSTSNGRSARTWLAQEQRTQHNDNMEATQAAASPCNLQRDEAEMTTSSFVHSLSTNAALVSNGGLTASRACELEARLAAITSYAPLALKFSRGRWVGKKQLVQVHLSMLPPMASTRTTAESTVSTSAQTQTDAPSPCGGGIHHEQPQTHYANVNSSGPSQM